MNNVLCLLRRWTFIHPLKIINAIIRYIAKAITDYLINVKVQLGVSWS